MSNIFDELNIEIKTLLSSYISSIHTDNNDIQLIDRVIALGASGDYQIIGTKPLHKIFTDDVTTGFVAFVNKNIKLHYVRQVTCTKIKNNQFIDIFIDQSYVLEQYTPSLNRSINKLNVLVDYPSPNTAKVLHIGHMRSIVIGDCIANFLEKLGHDVDRISHDGDFGTQFGILINYILSYTDGNISTSSMDDITRFYSEGKKQYDSDISFKNKSQEILSHIQNKTDQQVTNIWKQLITSSSQYCYGIFKQMNSSNKIKSIGESFYSDFWPDVKRELESKHLIEYSDGATVIFIEGYSDPLMLEKSNGCITYDTTDIIALWYRIKNMQKNLIIYLTDSGQNSHFVKLFKLAKIMEWDKNVTLKHIGFGKVYKPDGELIRTRDSSTIIKLEDIINEVIDTCKEACVTHSQSTDYSELMAINCMRYCEMSNIYSKGYNFNIKDVTRFNADSAIYTMYTYVRFNKIVAKSTAVFSGMQGYELDKHEAKLFKYIISFDSVVKKAEDTLELTPLTQYIPRICSCLSSYYESDIILGNKCEAQKVYLISKCLDIIKLLCNIMSITLLDEMK